MSDLREDLRRYIDHLADRADIEPTPDLTARVGPARRKRWPLLLAAAAIVTVVVAVIVVQPDGGGVVRSGPPSGGTPERGWRRRPLASAGLPSGASIWDVAAGGPGFVAVGLANLSGNLPAVWTSRDGSHWTSVSSRDLPQTHASALRVAAGPKGLVAVLGDFQGQGPTARATAVWWSSDGRRWRTVGSNPFGDASINQVIAGPDGFVAIGATPTAPAQMRAAAWSSPDGRAWHRSADPIHNTLSPPSTLYRVTRIGRRYIAFGNATTRAESMIWTSSNGRTWQAKPSPLPDVVIDAATTRYGVVAVTESARLFGGSLWLTHDGRSWQSLPGYHATFPAGSPDKIASVATSGVLAGSTLANDGTRTFGAWTSSNLQTWTPMPPELRGTSSGCTNCAAAVHVAANRGQVVILSDSPFEPSYWTWSARSG